MIYIKCPACNRELLPGQTALQAYIRKSHAFTCRLTCNFSRLEISNNNISYMSFYVDHNERYEVALDRGYFNINTYSDGTYKILYNGQIDQSSINGIKILYDNLFDYSIRFIENMDLQ